MMRINREEDLGNKNILFLFICKTFHHQINFYIVFNESALNDQSMLMYIHEHPAKSY